jgi:hypothetical protein
MMHRQAQGELVFELVPLEEAEIDAIVDALGRHLGRGTPAA